MAKTLNHFAAMQKRDPSFIVKMQLDDQKRVKSLLWCHGSGRVNYALFGDVVTFDTTYRTNLYNLPFGLFVGVNNHFQSTIFGGVFLTEETIEAFQWTFQVFCDVMDNKHPRTILTDQCASMRAAIKTEFPNTRHRWCKWHVLRKAKNSLGKAYSKHSFFKRDLHILLDVVVSIETRWEALISTHHLKGNKYLIRAYENRAMWAKPYFADTFCAGMTSTQRSESANHLLKTYIPRSAPMHLFVSQYDRMITDREADEGREVHATIQKTRIFRVGVPVERHAARFYTRAMFERFSRELYKAMNFTAAHVGCEDTFLVTLMLEEGMVDWGYPSCTVRATAERSSFTCDCRMFEHSGMPCRHILKVLVQLNMKEIPAGLLVHRWGKAAKENVNVAHAQVKAVSNSEMACMHAVVYAAAMELVAMCNSSVNAAEIGIDFMNRAKQAICAVRTTGSVAPAPAVCGTNEGQEVDTTCVVAPPRVRSRGRPKESRLKSVIEVVKGKKRKRTERAEKKKVKLPVPSKRKSSRLAAMNTQVQATAARKCRLCGEEGHYRSTCHLNSTKGVVV
ncbi:hypothetical protein ACQ4PT_055757 [Festuca glaucescens]